MIIENAPTFQEYTGQLWSLLGPNDQFNLPLCFFVLHLKSFLKQFLIQRYVHIKFVSNSMCYKVYSLSLLHSDSGLQHSSQLNC